ncbi:DUF6395 domain-containing protein [Demequina sp. SO4-18]|uniref:DUF6395 domain-containing protein n=1 Tax=Demequina sp. SO4-18 TaxID=3401026 RepID=UPI003B598039
MEWSLAHHRLTLHHPKGEIYWVMPSGYEMPSPAIRSLAEHVLLTPFGETVEVLPADSAPGDRTAVAFSGGVDSAAVLQLVEDPLPIYTQVASPGGLHKLDNALLAVEEVGGVTIESNQDMLPKWLGKGRGFYGAAGWTTTSILLAEHFGLSTFTDGNIIEFVYLRTPNGHGTGYSPRDYSATQAAFARVGLHYGMPCAGLTEISTTKIASQYRYAMGCMRGEDGQPCLNCMKCYRKLAIQGTPIPTNNEVERAFGREWIPVLASFLWARDNHGLSHTVLDSVERDYSWVDKWYPRSIEMIPEHLRAYFLARLDDFGIAALEDDSSLVNWDSRVGGS